MGVGEVAWEELAWDGTHVGAQHAQEVDFFLTLEMGDQRSLFGWFRWSRSGFRGCLRPFA